MLLTKLVSTVVVMVVFFGLAEGALRLTGSEIAVHEKRAILPMVVMKFGTIIEQLPTELNPPGYLWQVPENYMLSDPRMAEFLWPRKRTEGRHVMFMAVPLARTK